MVLWDKASQCDNWSKLYREDTCYRLYNGWLCCGSITEYSTKKFLIIGLDDIKEDDTATIIDVILSVIHNYNCEEEILECLQKQGK